MLEREFLAVPDKWQQRLAALGEVVHSTAALQTFLDDWFGERNKQLRTAIEHAAAITYYRRQSSVPVVGTLVCDDAGQFKLLTDRLALCWVHEGRHYEKLSPVAGRHAVALESFRERYWDYYAWLQDYRAGPSDELASRLRLEFDELFSRPTGYDALDDRRAKTFAKREELLTVLSEPTVPLKKRLGVRCSREWAPLGREFGIPVPNFLNSHEFSYAFETCRIHGCRAFTKMTRFDGLQGRCLTR